MNRIKTALLVLIVLLAVICAVSVVNHRRIHREINAEYVEAGRVAEVIASLIHYTQSPADPAAHGLSVDECFCFLNELRRDEEHDRGEAAWGDELADIDSREIALVEQIIATMSGEATQRTAALESLAEQFASIDRTEAIALDHTQRSWHTQQFWTGTTLCVLLLMQAFFTAGSMISGAVYTSSLGGAEERFGTQQVAQRYLTKRQRVETFELRAIRHALKALPEVRKVFDIPCGTGRFVPTLQAMGFDYYGADSSQSMVDLAREHRGLTDAENRVIQCNILDIHFPDRTFDCIFVMRLLHHVPSRDDRVAMFKELARKTRFGVVASFFDSGSLSHLLYVARCSLRGKPLQRYAVSVHELNAELHEAGLEIVHVTHRLRWLHRGAIFLAVPALHRTA